MGLRSYSTGRYSVDIDLDDRAGRIVLRDAYTGVEFADSDYRYSVYLEYAGEVVHLHGLYQPRVAESQERGGMVVSITGRLGEPGTYPAVEVGHSLYLPEDGEYLEETLTLQNPGEQDLVIRGYRFGFRKRLERQKAYGGPGLDIDSYRLVALPFRLQPDGKKHDYQLDDIYHGRYQCSEFHNPTHITQEVVDRGRGRSEGWAWTDGENGLLMIKYNPEMVEYSMLETERRGDSVYLNFGGSSPSLFDEPAEAGTLNAGRQLTFGVTRCHFYEGLWRRGSYMFREYMAGMGHGLPDNYDPPVHWNELYDIGWHHNNPEALAQHYSRESLARQAKVARDIGCDVLYLDPGWETCEGATRWDDERLGDATGFVREMEQDHGLGVAFRTIGRSYCDDYRGMYRRSFNGSIGYYAPYQPKPFYEPCICSRQYQQDKLGRILRVADAGMRFIMFDEFDWRGPCFDPSHGHDIPTTPAMHTRAVMDLVRNVHERHPGMLIEAHDPVWPWGVRYLPFYFMHEPETFDEAWAFEFMWSPLEDLLSGRALSLFYYNLAYDLPLYLHINMDNDNDASLAFWWYASTVRHIGIGGSTGNETRLAQYRDALRLYRSLKQLYAQGTFYGVDELTHVHVLPEEGHCVVNAFNITDTPVSRQVELRLNDLGLMEDLTVDGAPHEIVRGRMLLDLSIPPFSPAVISMRA